MLGPRGPYGANSLTNGLVDGYSADLYNYNLIMQSIRKNDDRNGTEYQCMIIQGQFPGVIQVLERGDVTILYVAGEYCMLLLVITIEDFMSVVNFACVAISRDNLLIRT